MASKWSKLKDKVPPFEIPPEWAAKIDEAKATYIGLNTAELAREFVLHRNVKKNLENQVKLENTEMEALSQLLVSELEGTAMAKVTLLTGETIYVNSEPYATVEDKPKMMAWLKKSKLQSLLSLNYQTMSGLVKEYLAAGKEPPPGIKVYLKTSARVRGGNNEENE